MRAVIAAALAVAIGTPLAALADGEYCVIPKLTPGVPTRVDLEYIGKSFCGMAIVDRKYVRLDEITKEKIEGATECRSDNQCQRTTKYFTDESRATAPFIIIFQGPKQQRDA